MIVLDYPQGSPDWLHARAGVVTASCADKVMTPKTMEPVDGDDYFGTILAERILGAPIETETSAFMERGSEMEAKARGWYEFLNDVKCESVGLILSDDGFVGASPDFFVGKDGGGEIKCPGAKQHAINLDNPEKFRRKHRGQTQVAMLLSGRAWWDTVSFCPGFPNVCVRSEPEILWRKKWGEAVGKFLARVDEALKRIGPIEASPKREPRSLYECTGNEFRNPNPGE